VVDEAIMPWSFVPWPGLQERSRGDQEAHIYPKQVLIDVLLAEIVLDDDVKFGVEWSKFLDTLSHGRYQQEIIIGSTPPETIPIFTSGCATPSSTLQENSPQPSALRQTITV